MAGKPGNPYHDAKGLFSSAQGARRTAEQEGALARKGRPMSAGQQAAKAALNKKIDAFLSDSKRAGKAAQDKIDLERAKQRSMTPKVGTLATLGGRGVMVGHSANGITTVSVGGQTLRVKTSELAQARAASNRNPRTNSRTMDDGSVITNGTFRGPRRRK